MLVSYHDLLVEPVMLSCLPQKIPIKINAGKNATEIVYWEKDTKKKLIIQTMLSVLHIERVVNIRKITWKK